MLYFKHACKQLKQRPLFALALFGIALAPAALPPLVKMSAPAGRCAPPRALAQERTR